MKVLLLFYLLYHLSIFELHVYTCNHHGMKDGHLNYIHYSHFYFHRFIIICMCINNYEKMAEGGDIICYAVIYI